MNTENIRLIDSFLNLQYVMIENNEDYKKYKQEYDLLAELDDDPVGKWLKLAKAKGETQDSDQVLLTLVVELHRKIDVLTQIIKNEKPQKIDLQEKIFINKIGYEYFAIEKNILKDDKQYYGRVELPTFPKRDVPLFFKLIKDNIIRIELMHDRDVKDWDNYVAARERTLIREMRIKNGKL